MQCAGIICKFYSYSIVIFSKKRVRPKQIIFAFRFPTDRCQFCRLLRLIKCFSCQKNMFFRPLVCTSRRRYNIEGKTDGLNERSHLLLIVYYEYLNILLRERLIMYIFMCLQLSNLYFNNWMLQFFKATCDLVPLSERGIVPEPRDKNAEIIVILPVGLSPFSVPPIQLFKPNKDIIHPWHWCWSLVRLYAQYWNIAVQNII